MTAPNSRAIEELNLSVAWPAIIHYSGDDELVFIGGLAEWLEDDDLSGSAYEVSDRLIDSRGRVFRLVREDQQSDKLLLSDEKVSVQQLTGLLRKHFSVRGACCISKIQSDSLADCMKLLRHDQES